MEAWSSSCQPRARPFEFLHSPSLYSLLAGARSRSPSKRASTPSPTFTRRRYQWPAWFARLVRPPCRPTPTQESGSDPATLKRQLAVAKLIKVGSLPLCRTDAKDATP
ncbi:hypothetical protein BGZ61DRAFT_443666 [Ilyonectria robusta]|uniref:uncharacterized protein n=1 Tax=Ilyonectria robusta TaxID=1079257 RepID=UPI001E8E5C5B|nr:uncharacterized protein BGZ61DRAFT_443666 [Ilyonectria robusta]KAH8735072.1 hypothetical protein BGZ61DRAFT_443666 [Ilyonectria robusta]